MSVFAPPAATVVSRSNFSFSVEGLAPREELLFKSLVRLLGHCTHHGWFYTPERSAEQLDLRVLSEPVAARLTPAPGPLFQAVLTVGVVERNERGYLTFPLHANVLEAELNRLGSLIEATRSAAAAAAASAANAAGLLFITSGQPFKLIGWPKAALLGSPARLRMATLLVSRALTLAELAKKTNQQPAQCIAFVDDLRRANLLTDGAQTPPANVSPRTVTSATHPFGAPEQPKTASKSLLSRIRHRLGL